MNAGDKGAKARLKRSALSMGASLFGIADLVAIRADTNLLDACYDRYTRGISIGVRLDDSVLADMDDGPTPEYCRDYLRANELLDSIAEAVAAEIRASGAEALPIPASKVIDWEQLRGHVSHKLIGRYAGHGWIGKNILLVNPDFGARVRYVTVLTDADLAPDAPLEEDCRTCARCVVVGPARAPADAAADFNLQACFNKLAEFNERFDEPHFICGLCVKACEGTNAQGRC